MQFLYLVLFSLGILAADQVTKLLVVQFIALGRRVPLIPGLVRLTHVHNTGAAFSMLQGGRWLFVALFVGVTVLLLWEYFRRPMPFAPFERWCIAAIYGGGLGNLVDRLRLGYVIDMIETEFIRFPVFNVADSFITCGSILLVLHLVLFNKRFWRDEKK